MEFRESELAAGRVITDSALVFMAGGLTDRVWDNSDRLKNNQMIALIYLGVVTVFASVLVSAVQVGYCASRKS